MVKYYPINEDAARRAKEANSFSDYVEGTATARYRAQVDEAVKLAEVQKERVDPMYHEKIDGLLDRYARKLAEYVNKGNEIDSRVPSVLIAGPANFPVKAKERQNAARDRNMEFYAEVQGILRRIKSTGMGGVMSDDKNALDKLRAKLANREALQQHMKDVNAYYRKHKTLEGCPGMDETTRLELEAQMSRGMYHDTPYPSYALTNNNAVIRSTKERIAKLEREAQKAAESAEKGPVEGDGYKLVENTEIMRIQFLFDGKPDDITRSRLKAHGFHWSPAQKAWQRMLNDNGREAARKIIEGLK